MSKENCTDLMARFFRFVNESGSDRITSTRNEATMYREGLAVVDSSGFGLEFTPSCKQRASKPALQITFFVAKSGKLVPTLHWHCRSLRSPQLYNRRPHS